MATYPQRSSALAESNSPFSTREETLMDKLAQAHAGLRMLRTSDDNVGSTAMVDVQTEEGHGSCSIFLGALEAMADTLNTEIAPRSYRSKFSVNYRALFPGNARHYRADILEEFSADQRSSIWVNGEFFQLSDEVLACGKRLQSALGTVTRLLEKWQLHSVARRSLLDIGGNTNSNSLSNSGFEANNNDDNRDKASSNKIKDRTGNSTNNSSNNNTGNSKSHGNASNNESILHSSGLVTSIRCPARNELIDALEEFDRSWAQLEERYIMNLIAIEDRARLLILEAIQAEKRLWVVDDPTSSTPWMSYNAASRKVLIDLTKSIAKLNSVANCRRKGRDDLDYDILEGAYSVLRASSQSQDMGGIRVLAVDILGCFDSIRQYLRRVSLCLERVDPHLCNNTGLVSRLVEWEECWEVCGRYVRDPKLMTGLSTVVNEIRELQLVLPRLKAMCDDFDVEWFMVLPRLTLLVYLRDPNADVSQLMRQLMPQCFRWSSATATPKPLQGFLDLQASFNKTRHLLDVLLGNSNNPMSTSPALGTQKVGNSWGKSIETLENEDQDVDMENFQFTSPDFDLGSCSTSWEVFARRALNSAPVAPGDATDKCRDAIKSLEAFTLLLERSSLDLQRHCAEDWNQCSAILVQCITGVSKRQQDREFQV